MKHHLSERAVSGCPCGRVHPSRTVPRLRKPRQPEAELGRKVYALLCEQKAVQDPRTGFWWLAQHGSCISPLIMSAHGPDGTRAKRLVRCRACVECYHARRYYWGLAAVEQTRAATEAGFRTWFGTLTLNPEAQGIMLDRARLASDEPNACYWDDPKCDARFAAVRQELVLEVRRYWARLRRCGHRFKYLLVFERHKSGLPHMHFLLHEGTGPILKRELQSQWPWGFSNCHIVGGRAGPATDKAAWYVVKYLSKSKQSRQIASKGYRPKQRACRHSEAKTNVNIEGSRQHDGSPSRAKATRSVADEPRGSEAVVP